MPPIPGKAVPFSCLGLICSSSFPGWLRCCLLSWSCCSHLSAWQGPCGQALWVPLLISCLHYNSSSFLATYTRVPGTVLGILPQNHTETSFPEAPEREAELFPLSAVETALQRLWHFLRLQQCGPLTIRMPLAGLPNLFPADSPVPCVHYCPHRSFPHSRLGSNPHGEKSPKDTCAGQGRCRLTVLSPLCPFGGSCGMHHPSL